jgi:hypothetical protein
MWSRDYRVLWLSEHSSLSLHNSDIVSYPEQVKSTVEPSIPLTSYIPNIHSNVTVFSTCKAVKWTLTNKCLRQTRFSPWTEKTFECVLHIHSSHFSVTVTFGEKGHLWIPALSFPPIHSLNLIVCWPCIIVHQYNETNVMKFAFSLLRIKDLYMFRALLAHPQEVLHKQHFVYCRRIMSVGCAIVPQSTESVCTQYTKYLLCNACWGWASNARNM